jgi:hypothetical protein
MDEQINNLTKKSERLVNKNRILYKNICNLIISKLNLHNEIIGIKNKLNNVIVIHKIILENFNLLFSHDIHNKSYLFYILIINKANDLINEQKIHIDNGYKLKTLYKEFSKIISVIESKYIDYMSINTKKNDLVDTECPICIELIKKHNLLKTRCGHYFHKKCIYKHILNINSCPMCRELIMDK